VLVEKIAVRLCGYSSVVLVFCLLSQNPTEEYDRKKIAENASRHHAGRLATEENIIKTI
jgi:hypothetical protein